MGRPLKIAKYDSYRNQLLDTGFPNDGSTDNGFSSSGVGVVGGETNTNGDTLNIKARVKIGTYTEADGFVLRQKGKHKFLVTDGTNTGICTLANTNNGSLASDTMTVTVTTADSSTHKLTSLTNKWGVGFDGTKYLLSFAHNGVVTGTAYAEASVNHW
jgi:hypothetical protein